MNNEIAARIGYYTYFEANKEDLTARHVNKDVGILIPDQQFIPDQLLQLNLGALRKFFCF